MTPRKAFENARPNDVSDEEWTYGVNAHVVAATHAPNLKTGKVELLVHELVATGQVDEGGRPIMGSVQYRGTQARQRLAQAAAPRPAQGRQERPSRKVTRSDNATTRSDDV